MADTVTLRAKTYIPRPMTGGGEEDYFKEHGVGKLPPGHIFSAPQGAADYLVVNHYAERVTDYPVHVGGGWYELEDGRRIQGKEEAMAAASEDTE